MYIYVWYVRCIYVCVVVVFVRSKPTFESFCLPSRRLIESDPLCLQRPRILFILCIYTHIHLENLSRALKLGGPRKYFCDSMRYIKVFIVFPICCGAARTPYSGSKSPSRFPLSSYARRSFRYLTPHSRAITFDVQCGPTIIISRVYDPVCQSTVR